MSYLKIKNIYKSFSKIQALKDFSLSIKEGEFIVIVGPSGCGKSTLLRMIAGLESPDKGSLYLQENQIDNIPPQKRNFALMFQSYTLFPHLSIFDNMAYGLKLKKVPKKEIRLKVEEIAQKMGLTETLTRRPSQLSGGQKQRAALGRAIVRNPDLLLLDEPLSNLDAQLRTQMRAEITQIHQQTKTTIVYVTHDQVEAMTMGDRIVVLKKGVIQQIGTPTDIYLNPQNKFVAHFMGSPGMNILEEEFKLSDSSLTSHSLSLKLSPSFPTVNLQKAHSFYLGIRPENVQVVEASQANITLPLHSTEHLGSQVLLYFKMNSSFLIVRSHTLKSIPIGTSIPLRFPLEHIHLFDSHTGKTLNISNL